ncbi:hypothetical protein G5I_01608 [Acromyrmex echinatior]|uniref:Uncharacterized protein n=1 Tax=Acromyrmex echinatior TaxID=103372 RepID=F4W831_ACREC|nr:hypothetical protein G5I_01608 [Acromyrmex echinatior]
MALLPIWITSGSCFALIHPGTNDVPPTTSRSLMRIIELLVRKATGVHFTFLQILQKRVAGNTLSLGSTKNNIKYNYNRENSRRYKYHDMNAMLSALIVYILVLFHPNETPTDFNVAQVSGLNGRKLPPFELLAVSKIEFATDHRSFATHLIYRAIIPYTATTSFCEATVKLAIVHFAQLDRNGVVKEENKVFRRN